MRKCFPTKYEPLLKDSSCFFFQNGDTEDCVEISKNEVFWIRSGVLKEKYILEQKVQQVIFCNFPDMSDRALVILTTESLKIYSQDGDVHQVPIPMRFSKIWALGTGLVAERQISPFDTRNVPFFFSLSHPLEEFSPVCYTDKDITQFQHFKYFTDPTLRFMAISDKIALATHEKSKFHFLFTIHHLTAPTEDQIVPDSIPTGDYSDGGDIESKILFKLVHVSFDEFKAPFATSVFIQDRDITLFKKDLNLAYHFRLEEEVLKPNFIIKDITHIVPIKVMNKSMWITVEKNSLFLYFEKFKVCQLETNGSEIRDLNNQVNDSVSIVSKDGTHRVVLSMDTISELVQKCWDVLLTILPRDIYVTMLREYLLMNEHQEEWKSFVKIFTTFNKEIKDILKPYIANITFGLHLLYENFKLSIITIPYLKALGLLLAMLATTLKWKLFLDLYYRDFGCKMITGESKGPAIVPNIFQWIQLENYEDFPFCGFSVECIEKLTRTVKLFSCLSSPEDFLSELIRNNMTRADIDFYPFGVSKIFRNVLEKLKMKPLSHFGPAEYNLIEREDLASLFQKEFEPQDQFYDFETRVGKNIFPDKRLEQIYAKLSSSTPINAPDDNDINFQEFLVKSSKRICSNSIGRGMLSLSSSKLKDENTKLFVIPPLVLAVKAVRNVISNLDMSQMAPNALLWPEFHHGCSYGLAIISPEKLTREWILHQKPQGANCYFSGFLLSLGLNGHLISFLATDVYTLLHSKHMPTTVSTLLGVCVSKRGSQDMNLTKALSLHIPSLTSSIDLEIAQETQAASLVSLGYLYLDSSHRFISEILLNELTRQSDDCITDREGYALAAGIGLGLVNLGRGNTSQGLTDLKLTEKLKLYMLGGKLKVTSKKPLDYSIKIKESDVFINTIISGSAATICLCLLYLQTNDTLVASYMEIPRSKYLLEYIKPMQAYLRTLCRNLILWKDIHASESWILNQVIKNSEDEEDTEVEVAALNAHIISGACMSIGMKYAGTGNKDAIKVILHFLHKFEASTVDSLSKETCILMSAIAVSLVVAGSGNIEIVKVLNRIRKYQVTFGNHMALSMALGVVFLGGCRFSFSTSKFAIANLLIAFFPRFPSVSTENRFHLQALRHFYVLAAEPRFLETVDVETGVEVVVEVRITVSDDEIIVKTPCLLPEIGCIRSIHVEDEKFYPLHITHENQIAKLKNMKIYLKRNQKEDVQKWLVPLAKEANDSISLWSLKLSFEENVTFENIFARLERKFELNKDVLKNYLLGKLMDDEFDEKFALGLVLFDIPTPGGLKTLEMNSSHVLGGLCLQNPKWECLSLNTIENVLKELKNE